MSTVELTIAGRNYRVACSPGEEAQLARLGEAVAAKVQGLGNTAGQPEARQLLFAALLLADEAHEADLARQEAVNMLESLANSLESMATRLETLASGLESAPDNP